MGTWVTIKGRPVLIEESRRATVARLVRGLFTPGGQQGVSRTEPATPQGRPDARQPRRRPPKGSR